MSILYRSIYMCIYIYTYFTTYIIHFEVIFLTLKIYFSLLREDTRKVWDHLLGGTREPDSLVTRNWPGCFCFYLLRGLFLWDSASHFQSWAIFWLTAFELSEMTIAFQQESRDMPMTICIWLWVLVLHIVPGLPLRRMSWDTWDISVGWSFSWKQAPAYPPSVGPKVMHRVCRKQHTLLTLPLTNCMVSATSVSLNLFGCWMRIIISTRKAYMIGA